MAAAAAGAPSPPPSGPGGLDRGRDGKYPTDDDDEDQWDEEDFKMDTLRLCYRCGKRSYVRKGYCLNLECVENLVHLQYCQEGSPA